MPGRELSVGAYRSVLREFPEKRLQGYLAHKKATTPLGPPQDPRHSPSVGSEGVAVSYERGTPVLVLQVMNEPKPNIGEHLALP